MTPRPRVADIYTQVRRHLTRRVRGAAMLWTGVAAVAVLLVAWLLAGSEGWSQGTAAPLVLDLILIGVVGAMVWMDRRFRSRWLSEARLTGSMEEAAGLRWGTVRGSLEVARSLPSGVSRSLAERAERDVVRDLDLPEEKLAGQVGEAAGLWTRRAVRGLVLTTPLLLLVALLSPGRSLAAWSGMGSPFDLLHEPALPELRVEPGDAEVLRGASLEVRVIAPGRQQATLEWQAAGDVVRSQTSAIEGDRVGFVLREVRAPVDYWVRTPDGARSDVYRVTPVDPLFVNDVTIRLTFPGYTGRVPEEFRGRVPPLLVPAGTRIDVDGRASRELRRGALYDAGGQEVLTLVVDGPSFGGSWVPRESGVFDWSFEDAGGAPAEILPSPLDLTLVADSAPTLRITYPGRDTILPLSLRQPLVLEARDDYGVSSLELVATRITSLGERKEPLIQRMEVGANRGFLARPLLDFSAWGLLPGDTVRYFAIAFDNSPSAQSAVSREYVLRMPSVAELRRAAQERLEETAVTLEELAERAGLSAEETRELERQAFAARAEADSQRPFQNRPPPGEERIGFEEQEDLRQALERQAEMESVVDSLRAELAELSEAMEDAGAANPELSEDLQELQRLLEEIATPEMREQLARMLEQLDQMDAREARQSLQRLSEDQEAFRQRLEESLERFRRAAVEQDFRATTEEAEALAQLEKALADAMREGDQPDLRADQQEGLRERTEEMEERMQRLEQRLQELEEASAAEQVRSARERSAEARESMTRAGQQARQRQGEEGGAEADRASEQLSETADQLREAHQDMAQQQEEAMRQALQETADDALSLARRQADLGKQMRGAGQDQLAELRGDVAAVQQGVRNMANNLAEASQVAGGTDRNVSTGMGEAMEALQRTIEAMENRAGSRSPGAAAQTAVAALNQVALQAMAGAQQSGEGQGSAEQQAQQMLESLAQQQGQLNNETSQVVPMQLGQQAMQSMLDRLAQGQQSVADQIGELNEQPGEQSLGDLEAFQQEAEALAEQLSRGRLDALTRERQERLFHRLLDAGRSLEKDEFSDEREARAPGEFERGVVLQLSPEDLGALRFQIPDAAALQRLSPAARRLVLQYFERLNQRSAAGGAGPGGGGPSR